MLPREASKSPDIRHPFFSNGIIDQVISSLVYLNTSMHHVTVLDLDRGSPIATADNPTKLQSGFALLSTVQEYNTSFSMNRVVEQVMNTLTDQVGQKPSAIQWAMTVNNWRTTRLTVPYMIFHQDDEASNISRDMTVRIYSNPTIAKISLLYQTLSAQHKVPIIPQLSRLLVEVPVDDDELIDICQKFPLNAPDLWKSL